MKQICDEFLKKDFYVYWQKNGVNKRLKGYSVLSRVLDCLVFLLEVIIYFCFTQLLISVLGDLYTMNKNNVILDYMQSDLYRTALNVLVCMFILLLMGNLILPINSHLITVRRGVYQFVHCLPFAVLTLLFIAVDFDSSYQFGWLLVWVKIIQGVLNWTICRIQDMKAFAEGRLSVMKACNVIRKEEDKNNGS